MVLRSYYIAGICVGPCPVYASVVPRRDDSSNEDVATVQIVWQDLVDFAPVTCGRMYIEVVTTGISAMRGPGNASPLAGEEILVKRLSDASSQAVEKGLAVKVVAKKAEVAVATLKRLAVTAVVTPTICVNTIVDTR